MNETVRGASEASGDSGRWSVLLEQARPVEAALAGRALAEVLGLEWLDARQRARASGGLLAEGIERARAQALCERLAALGIAAHSLPQDRLAPLVSPLRVAVIEWTEQGLLLRPAVASAPDVTVAGDEIDLALAWALRRQGRRGRAERSDLARAALRLGEPVQAPEGALRLADTLARLRKREQARIELGLDLYCARGAYRLVADRLQWRGDRPETGFLAHTWWALVERIAARLEPGALAPATRALREGLADPLLFHSREEIARYARWWRSRTAAGGDAMFRSKP